MDASYAPAPTNCPMAYKYNQAILGPMANPKARARRGFPPKWLGLLWSLFLPRQTERRGPGSIFRGWQPVMRANGLRR